MSLSITAQQFNQMPRMEKSDLLERYGTYLEVYQLQGTMKVDLFYLASFYVEVYFDQVNDVLLTAVAFTAYKKLDPYVKELDITEVYTLL